MDPKYQSNTKNPYFWTTYIYHLDHHGISILFAALVLLLEEEMRKLGVRRTSSQQLTRWTPR